MNKLILAVSALSVLFLAACNSVSDAPLPRSMKGYELYSWQEEGEWRFTLITGTNRNKTIEEILVDNDIVSPEGQGPVRLRAEDTAEIKEILSRVPENEFVLWSDGRFVESYRSDIRLELPPAEIINEINEHAEKLGLEFNVTFPY